jgi:3-hydroxyisobutyrate dehydrogenase
MKLGFIGLGMIGSGMASRLLDSGHKLAVFDLREEAVADMVQRGAIGAASPMQVAQSAEVVILMLSDL